MENESIRLSKYLAQRGYCSRREADQWIEQGWVRVDGKPITTLGTKVKPSQNIEVTEKALKKRAQKQTILLNKPVGYVSGQPEKGYQPAIKLILPDNRWPEDPSGIDFSPAHLQGLATAGRLDIDSFGLLIFTQDGRVAKKLIGANSNIEKEYMVSVSGHITDQALGLLRHGLNLDGKALKPAKVVKVGSDKIKFILREGKKRQIRRMCQAVGLKVTQLVRIRVGTIQLSNLPLGQWRYLTPDEEF